MIEQAIDICFVKIYVLDFARNGNSLNWLFPIKILNIKMEV